MNQYREQDPSQMNIKDMIVESSLKALGEGYALGMSQRADELDANKRLLDASNAEILALRARVTELEGEVEAARTTAIREAVERLSDEVIARELSPSVDPYGNIVWWFDDAASFRTALLAALLPAPAPGRDPAAGPMRPPGVEPGTSRS